MLLRVRVHSQSQVILEILNVVQAYEAMKASLLDHVGGLEGGLKMKTLALGPASIIPSSHRQDVFQECT